MPEGHVVHRWARRFRRDFGGQVLAASSPQGRFADGAALVDGRVLTATDAHGKQMFLGLRPSDASPRARPDRWLRVHLGLYGKWTTGTLDPGGPPAPRGAVRVRLVGERRWADLRGPTACEVVTPEEKAEVHARLGPDPLRADADPDRFVARVTRSRAALATLLMDQAVVAGVGNVYRAESLFRLGLPPDLPGRDLDHDAARALWDEVVVLLRAGEKAGRIVTVAADERPPGRARREDSHYVYLRAGRPCRRCGTPVAARVVATRNLFWCPVCQGG